MADQAIGTVSSQIGTVTARNKSTGEERSLQGGDEIFASDVIRTGDGGVAIFEFSDGSRKGMASNSEIDLQEVAFTTDESMIADGALSTIEQIEADIAANPAAAGGQFATPIGTLTAAAGEIRAVSPDGSSRVLSEGDPLFAGDTVVSFRASTGIIEYADGSSAGISSNSSVKLVSTIATLAAESGHDQSAVAVPTDGAPTAGQVAMGTGIPVGEVSAASGTVIARAPDGSERTLQAGDQVHVDEQISTGQQSTAIFNFYDGSSRGLASNSEVTLNGNILNLAALSATQDEGAVATATPPEAAASTRLAGIQAAPRVPEGAVKAVEALDEDVAALQQAIEEGADPSEEAEATAAGQQGEDGGHDAVFLERSSQSTTVESGDLLTSLFAGRNIEAAIDPDLLAGIQTLVDTVRTPPGPIEGLIELIRKIVDDVFKFVRDTIEDILEFKNTLLELIADLLNDGDLGAAIDTLLNAGIDLLDDVLGNLGEFLAATIDTAQMAVAYLFNLVETVVSELGESLPVGFLTDNPAYAAIKEGLAALFSDTGYQGVGVAVIGNMVADALQGRPIEELREELGRQQAENLGSEQPNIGSGTFVSDVGDALAASGPGQSFTDATGYRADPTQLPPEVVFLTRHTLGEEGMGVGEALVRIGAAPDALILAALDSSKANLVDTSFDSAEAAGRNVDNVLLNQEFSPDQMQADTQAGIEEGTAGAARFGTDLSGSLTDTSDELQSALTELAGNAQEMSSDPDDYDPSETSPAMMRRSSAGSRSPYAATEGAMLAFMVAIAALAPESAQAAFAGIFRGLAADARQGGSGTAADPAAAEFAGQMDALAARFDPRPDSGATTPGLPAGELPVTSARGSQAGGDGSLAGAVTAGEAGGESLAAAALVDFLNSLPEMDADAAREGLAELLRALGDDVLLGLGPVADAGGSALPEMLFRLADGVLASEDGGDSATQAAVEAFIAGLADTDASLNGTLADLATVFDALATDAQAQSEAYPQGEELAGQFVAAMETLSGVVSSGAALTPADVLNLQDAETTGGPLDQLASGDAQSLTEFAEGTLVFPTTTQSGGSGSSSPALSLDKVAGVGVDDVPNILMGSGNSTEDSEPVLLSAEPDHQAQVFDIAGVGSSEVHVENFLPEQQDKLEIGDLLLREGFNAEDAGSLTQYLRADEDGAGNTVLSIGREENGEFQESAKVVLQNVSMGGASSGAEYIDTLVTSGNLGVGGDLAGNTLLSPSSPPDLA